MTDDNGLLAHLAWHFQSNEDAATDTLAYILQKYEGARAALADLLSERASPEEGAPVISRVSTRGIYPCDGTHMIPDLVGFNGNGEGQETVLVESKFWAALTPNQPCGYLRLMESMESASHLLFLAPSSRVDTMWPELVQEAERCLGASDDRGETKSVYMAVVGKKPLYLMLTSWLTLLQRMECPEYRVGSELQQLKGLCVHTGEAPYTAPDQSNKGRLDSYQGFVTLVKEAIRQAVDAETIVPMGVSYLSGQFGQYVRFIDVSDTCLAVARIGVDLNDANHLLHLWFCNNAGSILPDRMAKIREQLSPEIQNDIFPLPIGNDYNEALTTVVEKLEKLRDRLARPPQ